MPWEWISSTLHLCTFQVYKCTTKKTDKRKLSKYKLNPPQVFKVNDELAELFLDDYTECRSYHSWARGSRNWDCKRQGSHPTLTGADHQEDGISPRLKMTEYKLCPRVAAAEPTRLPFNLQFLQLQKIAGNSSFHPGRSVAIFLISLWISNTKYMVGWLLTFKF